MPELLFQSKQEKLHDGSPIIITKILGAIDGTTVRQFEDKLIGFFNQGVKNLILVFSEVKYINSTGMGLLVKLADKFQEGGGDIKLVGVPEKVIALFDMLGLLSLFKIYETDKDAIQSITAESMSSPAGNNAAVAAAPPPPPPPPVAQPRPAAPAPPPPPPAPAPPAMAPPPSNQMGGMGMGMGMGGGIDLSFGAESAVAPPPKQQVRFPHVAPCAVCQRSLEFAAKGNYKCPCNSSYITIDEFGNQSVHAKMNSYVIDMTYPCNAVYRNPVILAISCLAQQVGFSNVFCEEVKEALENAINITAEKSNPQAKENFHVLAVADANEMVIGLKSLNPFLVQNGPKDPRLPAIARKVDRLEVFPLPTRGQLLKMTKKKK